MMGVEETPTTLLPGGLMVRMVGEPICSTEAHLKGFNTYVRDISNDELDPDDAGAASARRPAAKPGTTPFIVSAACGVVETTERVVSVRGLSARYIPEVGDVVVGRVCDVLAGRWTVDIGAHQLASLLLSNVTEPGGMLRRRGREDELSMRRIFCEGDLVAAEVQRVTPDGFVSLHTRSATKYGRLNAGGTNVAVHAALVRRVRHRFHSYKFGVTIILGSNGCIWVQGTTAASLAAMHPPNVIAAASKIDEETGAKEAEPSPAAAPEAATRRTHHHQQQLAGFPSAAVLRAFTLDDPLEVRSAVARTCNCITVLSQSGVSIEPVTIGAAVEFTFGRQMKPFDVLKRDKDHVALAATARAARDHAHP